MKVIFAKYNSERLPIYQVVTKIVQDQNGRKYAIKEPLCNDARKHIKNIVNNYYLLKNKYNINLIKPSEEGDRAIHRVIFDLANGVSLEKLMLQAIEEGNDLLFQNYVEQYESFMDGFVYKRNIQFTPSENFKKVFGDWKINDPQDVIEISNIDLIFGNIFVNNGNFQVIDYEWVFDFEIPKSFIIWRAFYIFLSFHDIKIEKYNLERFFKYHDEFLKLEENFSSYVHGEGKKYILNRDLLKPCIQLNFENVFNSCQNMYFTQLYYDFGNGFFEENSERIPVVQDTDVQKFIFDLSDKQNIKALRLDPISDYCVIAIEKISVSKNDTEVDLLPYISGNYLINHGKSYFFNTNDPQLYFEALESGILSDAKRLTIEVHYVHIGIDALQACLNQMIDDNNAKISLFKEELDKKSAKISLFEEELNKKSAEIQNIKLDLSNKEIHIKDIENKYNEINNQLVHIYNSHGWKMLLRYYKIRDAILPEGSRMRRFFKAILKLPRLINKAYIKKGLAYIRMYGFKAFFKKIKIKISSHEDIEGENLKRGNSTQILDVMDLLLTEPYIPPVFIKKPIDIIIPVYNGREFLDPLLESIVKNTLIPYRLLIANDKSTDSNMSKYLADFKNNNPNIDITVIENEENLGFVKTVNKLAKLTKNHFVILNTDTEVPPHWLERIIYPIIAKDNIASVTPFTNAGTICSFPNFLVDNPIFENMGVATLDSYFQYVNFERNYVEIPTAVGFCMAINKKVYDKIGLFDEIFGKGYGEENDWSMRALKAGYKNIIVPNLFVYHKHGGSFPSEEKKKLMENNLKLLEKKHSNYFLLVENFIEKDPLEHIRDILKIKILSSLYKPIMILDHALGGGANEYTTKFVEDKNFVIIVKYNFKCNKYFVEFLGKKIDTISFEMQDIKEIEKIIKYFNVEEVIINELVSYPKILDILDFLVELKKMHNNINFIFMGHDYYCVCPMYNLLNHEIKYCNVPTDLRLCDKCIRKNYLIKTEVPFVQQDYSDLRISLWREKFGNLLKYSSKIICFSQSSKEIFQKAYPSLTDDKFEIKPHIVDWVRPVVIISRPSNLNLAITGAIGIPKGAEVVISIAEYIKENNLNIKLHIFGEIFDPSEKLKGNKNVLQHGRYNKFNLPKLMEDNKIDVVVIPSIWPETFSYTTEEAIKMDLPVAVFNLGAPAERAKLYDKGIILERQDSEYIIKTIYNYINKNIVYNNEVYVQN